MRVQVILPDEVVERIDGEVGRGSRSRWITEACEARLGSGAAVAQTPVKRTVAGSIPASPASNVTRYREKIAPLITGSWKTPREISVVTGIHERIVEKMLEGMDVEWERGAVRLR
jgi:hypothetical protein